MPVYVLTKSDLVLRDLDLLKEIHETAFANVVFTITLHEEEEQRFFEPKSSTTSERFEALKEIRKAGLFGGVMATPIIPGIGDNIDNMTGLAKEAKRAKAEFILWGGMTLKPGRQKDYFLNMVRRRFPDRLELLQRIYQDDHPYGHPIHEHLPVRVMTRGYGVCKRVGISDRSVRHKTPHEHDVNNQVLGVVLDIIFRRRYNLGKSWSGTKPFTDLAVRLERGVENLETLRAKGELAESLRLKEYLVEVVEEIIDLGTCEVLEDLESELDEVSKTVMD
jgi:MoaA/NifB/PqqE/SkfB family radical SAM enzyme